MPEPSIKFSISRDAVLEQIYTGTRDAVRGALAAVDIAAAVRSGAEAAVRERVPSTSGTAAAGEEERGA